MVDRRNLKCGERGIGIQHGRTLIMPCIDRLGIPFVLYVVHAGDRVQYVGKHKCHRMILEVTKKCDGWQFLELE